MSIIAKEAEQAISKKYSFNVFICDGLCNGTIEIAGANENDAYDNAMTFVAQTLATAFPTLGIDYHVELV